MKQTIWIGSKLTFKACLYILLDYGEAPLHFISMFLNTNVCKKNPTFVVPGLYTGPRTLITQPLMHIQEWLYWRQEHIASVRTGIEPDTQVHLLFIRKGNWRRNITFSPAPTSFVGRRKRNGKLVKKKFKVYRLRVDTDKEILLLHNPQIGASVPCKKGKKEEGKQKSREIYCANAMKMKCNKIDGLSQQPNARHNKDLFSFPSPPPPYSHLHKKEPMVARPKCNTCILPWISHWRTNGLTKGW